MEKAVYYDFSRLYTFLYSELLKGCDMYALVNYTRGFEEGEPPARDIVRVRRFGKYDILIGCRGIEYGSVCHFERDKDTELNLFIKECTRLDLEWITGNKLNENESK